MKLVLALFFLSLYAAAAASGTCGMAHAVFVFTAAALFMGAVFRVHVVGSRPRRRR